MTTEEIIIEFALAHKAAEDNPKLLQENYEANVDECVRRMERVKLADQAILALRDKAALPKQVWAWLEANDNQACFQCRFSSRYPKHFDCEAKTYRYFKTRKELIELGLTLTESNG